MSAHVDKMDLKNAFDRLAHRLDRVSVGDRYPDVHAALGQLIAQIEAAGRAVETAEQRHRIDRADEERRRAEERLAELQL